MNESARPAHGKVHPPLAFEVVNHGVDRGGLKRVAADEEGMKGEDFAETLGFDVAGGHLPHGAVGAESDQIRSDPKHVGEGGEGLVGQFDESFLENGVGFSDKTAVALEVVGKVVTDLGLHFRLVAGVFEGLAIVPSNSVKRFAGDDLDVVGSFFPRKSEELIEKKRSGQDGGAGVVGESFVAEDRGATTRLLESLEESDIVATGLESNGGGEASKA